MSIFQCLVTGNKYVDGAINGIFLGFLVGIIFPIWLFFVLPAGAMMLPFKCQVPVSGTKSRIAVVAYLLFWCILAIPLEIIYLMTGLFIIGCLIFMIVLAVVAGIWNHGENIDFTVDDMTKAIRKFFQDIFTSHEESEV